MVTPPVAYGDSPLKEGAFDVAVPKSLPPRGRWHGASRDGRSEPQSLEKLELMKKALMQEYFG